jgi:hypothetical protein
MSRFWGDEEPWHAVTRYRVEGLAMLAAIYGPLALWGFR